MPDNVTTTTVDLGSVVLEQHGTLDGILENAGGAETTFVAGTLLGRHSTVGHLYPYDPAGSNGLNAPKYVLTYAVTIAAAGEKPVTVLSAGKVNAKRLVIHGGTPVTDVHLDALLDRPLIPVIVTQLGVL